MDGWTHRCLESEALAEARRPLLADISRTSPRALNRFQRQIRCHDRLQRERWPSRGLEVCLRCMGCLGDAAVALATSMATRTLLEVRRESISCLYQVLMHPQLNGDCQPWLGAERKVFLVPFEFCSLLISPASSPGFS